MSLSITNCQFPLIQYQKGKSYLQWGQHHGELFAGPIKELSLIRRELMLSKNPRLLKKLDELSLEQFEFTKRFAPHIAEEIKGIAEGSNLTLTEIVILNNYTDFRDIILPDEGCSTLFSKGENFSIAGQTWDMHRSAKNYLCTIQTPNEIILSLVGCVGLMGVNHHGLVIGVNNINTTDAQTGMIWPALVRQSLLSQSFTSMRETLKTAPVTSGHNYMIANKDQGEHWEISPSVKACAGAVASNQHGHTYHTNHCLHQNMQAIEDKKSMSSTTHAREELLKKLFQSISDRQSFYEVLTSHEGYPKSICSHFENGAQDPSFTCGGGIFDFNEQHLHFWRGCPHEDQDYKEYQFKLINQQWVRC